MSTPESTTAAPVKFHLCLNVRDMERALAFYRAMLGREPLKHHADYAKFELEDPQLVLSLKPSPFAQGGSLNHAGFRVPNTETLIEFQRRLESAGFRTKRQDGVECCYARQTKFWVADPDSNLWEIYVFHSDIDHKGTAHGLSGMMAPMGALGLTGMMRRGFGKVRAKVKCLLTRKCSGSGDAIRPEMTSTSETEPVPAGSAK